MAEGNGAEEEEAVVNRAEEGMVYRGIGKWAKGKRRMGWMIN